jgi:hypothetical protein
VPVRGHEERAIDEIEVDVGRGKPLAVMLDGANSPVASIEGNGSQEFHALFADYNNDLPNNPYGTSASMFRYNAGAVVGDATSGVTINGTAGA